MQSSKETIFRIHEYDPSFKDAWNNIVKNADNGHFMFNRNYMDYHSDRFHDASFVVFKNQSPIGIVPGNKEEKTWHTHQGLTFGGLVLMSKFNRISVYQDILATLIQKIKSKGFDKIIYKFIPVIYHKHFCENDIYILWKNHVVKQTMEISTAVNLLNAINPTRDKRKGSKKADRSNLYIEVCKDFEPFWDILSTRLMQHYGGSPVHSLKEINYLASSFPENIKLFVIKHPEKGTCGGAVIYEEGLTAHVQYSSANDMGMKTGSLQKLFLYLIKEYREKGFRFFDFGTSTENDGQSLNESLASTKEGFGGRSVLYRKMAIEI